MSAPAIKKTEAEPDFYSNTSWMVGEIVLAHKILARKINELRNRNQERTAVGQKLAAQEVGRLAEQMKICADILVRMSAEHLNRKPRP